MHALSFEPKDLFHHHSVQVGSSIHTVSTTALYYKCMAVSVASTTTTDLQLGNYSYYPHSKAVGGVDQWGYLNPLLTHR